MFSIISLEKHREKGVKIICAEQRTLLKKRKKCHLTSITSIFDRSNVSPFINISGGSEAAKNGVSFESSFFISLAKIFGEGKFVAFRALHEIYLSDDSTAISEVHEENKFGILDN